MVSDICFHMKWHIKICIRLVVQHDPQLCRDSNLGLSDRLLYFNCYIYVWGYFSPAEVRQSLTFFFCWTFASWNIYWRTCSNQAANKNSRWMKLHSYCYQQMCSCHHFFFICWSTDFYLCKSLVGDIKKYFKKSGIILGFKILFSMVHLLLIIKVHFNKILRINCMGNACATFRTISYQ